MNTLLKATLLVVSGLVAVNASATDTAAKDEPRQDASPADVTDTSPAPDDKALVEIIDTGGQVLGAYGELLSESDRDHGLTIADLDSMSFDQKLGLYNAVVDEDDRIICTREKPTGTRMEQEVCRTLRQINSERRWAQDTLRQAQRMNSLFPFGFLPEGPPTN